MVKLIGAELAGACSRVVNGNSTHQPVCICTSTECILYMYLYLVLQASVDGRRDDVTTVQVAAVVTRIVGTVNSHRSAGVWHFYNP